MAMVQKKKDGETGKTSHDREQNSNERQRRREESSVETGLTKKNTRGGDIE